MELMNLDMLQSVLADLAKDIRVNYKEHLAHHGRFTAKGRPDGYEQRLIDSVTTQVEVGEHAYEVTMTLNDYWQYVEEDTRPHFPPLDAIRKWVEIKPLLPRPNDNGLTPTSNQLAYLIARKISNEGTEGTHDLEQVKGGVIPWYQERIAEALGHDMEAYIRKIIADE